MDIKELGEYLFQPGLRDLLRIETLDWYDSAADDPHFARFRSGQPAQVDEKWQAWLDKIAADTAAGMTWRRVHVIAEGRALTEYLAFEFGEQYTRNTAAGELIRIVEVPPEHLPRYQDMFVAAGERVAISRYDADGRFQAADAAGRDAGYWVDAAQDLWRIGTPFQQWWANYQRKAA